MSETINRAEYLPLGEVFKHINALRQELCLPLLARTASLSDLFRRKKVPYIFNGKRKLYYLKSALYECSRLKHYWDAFPVNRVGTWEEVRSKEYLPLNELSLMINISMTRLHAATRQLRIKAWRHPHTNRVWGKIEDAMQVAFYRSLSFIVKYFGQAQADKIKACRPCRHVMTEFGTMKMYLCPEYSKIGTTNTRKDDET